MLSRPSGIYGLSCKRNKKEGANEEGEKEVTKKERNGKEEEEKK